jgi:Uncharacterized protein conserved in bacteria (DUF2059)
MMMRYYIKIGKIDMLRKQTFKTGIAVILALSAPAAVYAQAEDGSAATEISADGITSQSEEDAMLAVFTKIFDTAENKTPIDPVQLKLAETTASKLMPNGSMKNMMNQMINTYMTPIMNILPEMSSTEIMLKVGIYEGEIENLNDEKRKAITAMLDPTRKERGKQFVDVMTPLLDETMALLEPPMRTGISRAYARKFSAEQLRQINGFFATPTGALYAAESYPIQADPEVMQAMFKAMPKLIETLKKKVPSVEAGMKSLPKERELSDLSKAEMASLAKLLNVKVAALEEQREIMSTGVATAEATDVDVAAMDAAIAAGDAAASAAEASPYADETGDEPWYSEENWAKADRTKTDAAFKKRDKAETESSAAYSVWADAFEKAVGNAREKYKAEGWKPAPVVNTTTDSAAEAAASEVK